MPTLPPSDCVDTANGATGYYTDGYTLFKQVDCAMHTVNPPPYLYQCGTTDDDDFTASAMCCICGGGLSTSASDELCDEWQVFMSKGKTRDLAGALTLLDDEGEELEELRGYGGRFDVCADLDAISDPSKRKRKCKKAYRSAVVGGRTRLHVCEWLRAEQRCDESDEVTDVTGCYAADGADAAKAEWGSAWRQTAA